MMINDVSIIRHVCLSVILKYAYHTRLILLSNLHDSEIKRLRKFSQKIFALNSFFVKITMQFKVYRIKDTTEYVCYRNHIEIFKFSNKILGFSKTIPHDKN